MELQLSIDHLNFDTMTGQQTIYLIDDDDDDRFFFRQAVESVMEKVEVVEFDNGADFLKKMLQPGLDLTSSLILMDINMPRMSGLEVIAELKSLPHCEHLPVLAISTAADPRVIRDAIARGASAYFAKPYSPSGLQQLAPDIKEYFVGNN
jgi:response regulator RpfG family c-di-GMP phosphodiesterase